jgi:hypothetical protein
MRKIAVFPSKGGVGKTATAAHLAAGPGLISFAYAPHSPGAKDQQKLIAKVARG